MKKEIDVVEPKLIPVAKARQDGLSQNLLQPQFKQQFQHGAVTTRKFSRVIIKQHDLPF